ncbi:prohead protease/major capsid protein fusion protein [Mailhella massiliensis]|uniref:prohead protease/major capsid protein fusion protein n=1 Tax=Mailhella massiliensis TaxID=1903261 RepID=UPI002357C2B8|nr:prohead protease/major capsid protein fusion protein [Mailhella massiliensis]
MPNKRTDIFHASSRAVSLGRRGAPFSLNEAERSVEFTAATEQPVSVWDWEKWDVVPEVLRMDGVQLPASGQVPLLDTHDGTSVQNVLGSFGAFRTEEGQLIGRATFSGVQAGADAFRRVAEGHITDVSVGYEVLASTWVENGATATVEGVEYTGPVRVTTVWKLFEVSLCPVGADDRAKVRGNIIKTGGHDMPNKLPEQEKRFDASAAKEKLTAAVAALNELAASLSEPEEDKPDDAVEDNAEPAAIPESPAGEGDGRSAENSCDPVEEERARIMEISAMCRAHNMPANMEEEMIRNGYSLDKARAAVLARLEGRSSAAFARVDVGRTEQEKVREAVSHGLLLRCGVAESRINGGRPAPGAREFSGMSMREVCREMLVRSGRPTSGNVVEMVGRALSTTDLPNLLTDTANRVLMDGWESADKQWQVWCGQDSVSDFKELTLLDFASGDDLALIPEGGEYQNGRAAEHAESVKIETYGKIFPLTRQAIVNDDLGAFARIARNHGEAAARMVNRLVCRVLTANPTMGDGKALFHNDHGNLVSSGGNVPTVESLGAAFLKMRTQKDLLGNRVQIRPQFFIAPAALETGAEVFFNSQLIGTQEKPNQANIYAGSVLTRVYDAELDDVSAADWYLAGPKGKTVTIFTLNGATAPYLEYKEGWRVDGVEYKVRLDVAAKAVAWQGLCKSAG